MDIERSTVNTELWKRNTTELRGSVLRKRGYVLREMDIWIWNMVTVVGILILQKKRDSLLRKRVYRATE